MDRLEYIHIVEDILELDEGELQEESVLAECDEWDSLSKLALMTTVKKIFKAQLTQEELKGFITVKDVCDYMEKVDER